MKVDDAEFYIDTHTHTHALAPIQFTARWIENEGKKESDNASPKKKKEKKKNAANLMAPYISWNTAARTQHI